MPKAIRIHETGGPEVLTWEDIEVGDPGDGQIRIKQVASGLNFIIEISADLQNWSEASGDLLVVSENAINNNLLSVSAKLTDDLTQNLSRFIRIRVIIE